MRFLISVLIVCVVGLLAGGVTLYAMLVLESM